MLGAFFRRICPVLKRSFAELVVISRSHDGGLKSSWYLSMRRRHHLPSDLWVFMKNDLLDTWPTDVQDGITLTALTHPPVRPTVGGS